MNKKNEIGKIVFVAIILTLLFSSVAGMNPSAISSQSTSSNSLSHAVFAEFGTSTD